METNTCGGQEDSLLRGDLLNVNTKRHNSTSLCSGRVSVICIITCIASLVALVGICVFQSEGSNDIFKHDEDSPGNRVTLQEIVAGSLVPSLWSSKWISDHEFAHVDPCSEEADCAFSFTVTDVSDSRESVIFKLYNNNTYGHTYEISSDRKFLLAYANRKSLYRFSSTADYFFFNLTSKEHVAIEPSDQHDIRFAAFGPRGTQMVFSRAGDLHYKRSLNGGDSVILNGMPSGPGRGVSITNGAPDWMYEEEILKTDRSFWFSPDGSRLAFLSVDGSAVPVASVLHVGHRAAQDSQHLSFTYPKPGGPIPAASLWVADLDTDAFDMVRVPGPREVEIGGGYFTGAVWADDNRLLVSWMNRNQTKAYLVSCSFLANVHDTNKSESRQHCKYILEEESSGLWTEPIVPVPCKDGSKIAVKQQNEGTDSHEIVVMDFEENHHAITQFDLDVTKVHAFTDGYVYFEAVPEKSPRSKHVYQARSRGFDVRCLTCQFDGCGYNEAVFSPAASFYLHRCFGPVFPFSQVVDVTTGLSKVVIEDNQALKERLSGETNLTSHVVEIPVTDFWNASLKLFYRAGTWESGKKHPLLLYLYNAPETVSVTDKHVSLEDPFGTFMSRADHVIFGKMDVRGSGNQGLSRLREIYTKLGDVEVTDILTVVRYIIEHVPQVDPAKIALHGTSYGGFVTLRTLMQDRDSLVACGVAVAPVVDWRLYDAFYSEKFLLSPVGNPELYQRSSVLENESLLKGKKLMIAHGSSDDNVHIENSLKLVQKLVTKGIEHTFLLLPDEVHYLRNRNMKLHLFESIRKFLKHECFADEKHSHSHHH